LGSYGTALRLHINRLGDSMKNWYLRITLILMGIFPLLFYQNCSRAQQEQNVSCSGTASIPLPTRTVTTYFSQSHGKLRYYADGQAIFDECQDVNQYGISEDHRPTNLSISLPSDNVIAPASVHYQIYDLGANCDGLAVPTKFYDANIMVESVTDEVTDQCLRTYETTNQEAILHESPVTL
jgi:hypothetical protein